MNDQVLRIAGITPESIVDGPGLRWTLYTQGCPHRCPGCHNPSTHPMEGGREVTVQSLLDAIRKNPLLDGITLSGGEPLVQPEGCTALCAGAKAMGLNVWVYTGFTYEWLMSAGNDAQRALLTHADVLVDGRFLLEERSLELLYRGSKNQRLIDLPKSLAAGQAVLWERAGW